MEKKTVFVVHEEPGGSNKFFGVFVSREGAIKATNEEFEKFGSINLIWSEEYATYPNGRIAVTIREAEVQP